MRRRSFLTGTAVLTAASATACSRPGNVPGGSDAGGGQTGEITFQSLSDQPGAIAATKKIVESWNSANPSKKVTLVQAGWDGVYDKLVTQFNGETAPDVIHYEAASIIPFALDGYLADLTSAIPGNTRSDISENVWKSVTVDKKIIALPTEMQTYVVFANKKLLAAAGITPPGGDSMTWQQFREIAKATTRDGVFGVGWGLKSPTATVMAMAPTFGGTFFSGTGKGAKITVGAAELAIPKAMRDMATADKSLDPATLSQSGGDVLASFFGGKVAMTVQGSYQAANMVTDAPKGFEWVELPPLAGDKGPGQAANPQTLSVNIDSERKADAIAFVNFMAKPENMAALNQADGLIPASKAARDSILSSTKGANGWEMTLKSGEDLVAAPYLGVTQYPQWKDTVATPAFQKYLSGQLDDAGLAKALTDGWAQVTR